MVPPDDPREILSRAASAAGVSLSRLSRLIGRNPAYVQQHVTRGSPRRLGEEDRELIAAYLGIDPALLGGPRSRFVTVRRFDIAASAGAGTLAEIEAAAQALELPSATLAALGADAALASIIRVTGESMMPTLAPGDEILVDAAQRRVPRGGAVFVLRIGDALMVKRVRPVQGGVSVTSDNPASVSPGILALGEVEVIGRVVWVSRRL